MSTPNPPPTEPTPSNTTPDEISTLLSELTQIIISREKNNDQNPTPGIDPAVLQQLQAVSSHMQSMNDRLNKTIYQIDNNFTGVCARMEGLSTRLDSIESGLKILLSRSDEHAHNPPEVENTEKAAEEHNQRARLQNRRVDSEDKLVPLHTRHNRPIANFTPDTLYKLAYEANQDKIISWLQEFGQSTEKEGCQKRLIEFLGVSQDQIAKCYS